ncbi:MAG: Ada metal-binding domain-containing protein [Candidatus Woesearchaeota archaeon]
MRACPLCGSEVSGDSKTGYYCKRCNLIFDERETICAPDSKVEEAETKNLDIKSEEVKDNTQDVQKFITSAKAKRYHLPNCPFAQKIRPEKRIFFNSAEEAEMHGYKPCECTQKISP